MKRVAYVVTLLALASTVVAYFAIPTRMELVPMPPVEFFEARPEWDARRLEIEQRLARAYWDCAVVTIQWKYPYGLRLPEDPPGEFQIDARLLADARKLAPQSRERYWKRLQNVWHLRESWHRVRVWNSGWLTKPFEFWQGAIGTKR